jgi:hypothetical protein
MASDWQLFTGGRYSEVVVRTGLTVQVKESFKNSLQSSGKSVFTKFNTKIREERFSKEC